jgi:hypothetical protein
VWSVEPQPWHVGLSESWVAIAPPAGWLARSAVSASAQVLPSSAAADRSPSWQPSVAVLTDWLGKGSGRRSLRIHLSASFVRWLLIPWSPQLASRQEVHAYAQLQFRATFGEAAVGWRLGIPQPSPGEPLLVCAVDEALMSALEQCSAVNGVTVQHIGPHFSAAFDYWRGRMRRRSMWFVVVEAGAFTLSLSHGGLWRGVRTQRLTGPDSDWLQQFHTSQTQMRMSWEEDDDAKPPIFVVEYKDSAGKGALPEGQWLKPGGRLRDIGGPARLAWGV